MDKSKSVIIEDTTNWTPPYAGTFDSKSSRFGGVIEVVVTNNWITVPDDESSLTERNRVSRHDRFSTLLVLAFTVFMGIMFVLSLWDHVRTGRIWPEFSWPISLMAILVTGAGIAVVGRVLCREWKYMRWFG